MRSNPFMIGSSNTSACGRTDSTSWMSCWTNSNKRSKKMAVTSGTAKVTLPTDEQILITREFDAPKHLVYPAWTTPDLVKRWWNARRGEVTIAEIDLRVRRGWRYMMNPDRGFALAFHAA